MKYNEAIGMILDGGRATNSNEKKWWIWFAQSYTKTSRPTRCGEAGDLMVGTDEQICNVFTFNKKHVREDNWIVEKDGVVYEEYHPFADKKERFKTLSEDVSCPQCGGKMLIRIAPHNTYSCLSCSYKGLIYIKDRTGTEDEPAELEDNGQKWEKIKMPIIADKVNEDWLEKKMLCFMKRASIAMSFSRIDDIYYLKPEDIIDSFNCETYECHMCCGIGDQDKICEICFPDASEKDKAQGTIVPADKVILYTCIHGTYPCEECYEKYKKENKHSRQPREKVTVEDILWLLDRYVDALSIYHNALSAGDEPIVEKHTLMSLNKHYLMREIKYLVSLQEN